MNRLRAAMRRLDPWAALLLGGLLAMGVVILLATPGPWQRVVGEEPPVRLETPTPDDVAVFVMAGRNASCSGVIWLHVDAERKALTAVVVAPSISGFSPTDGFAPVSAIADSAGPGPAAEALGGALGVTMDAWVALDRKAAELAVQAMVPLADVKAARTRYHAALAAWRGRGGAKRSWATQYETLNIALPQVPFEELGVVAFSNYVLGFGFVRSDLTLQGVTSLGEALRDVDRGKVEVRAAPVVIERCGNGEVWRADASRVEPLRQSLAIGIRPPETDRLVSVREREARVLVVAPVVHRAALRYAAEVRRGLERSAGRPVEVALVAGTDEFLAARTERELDRSPALAVLVAPASEVGVPAVGKVYALLRSRRQEAVASGPLQAAGPPGQEDGESPEEAVVAGRLPVSWLPEAIEPDATPDVAASASGAADVAWETAAPSASAPSMTDGAAGLTAAARANVQTLVRACWPGTLSPRLISTALRFSFVEARHTRVGVVIASDAGAEETLARLRLWGFAAARLELQEGGWQPPGPGPLVCHRPGARTAALALAGDLGLPARSVIRTGDNPRKLVLVLPD